MLLDTHNTLISYSHSHLFECKLNTQLFTLCFNDYDYLFLYIVQTFCNAFPVQCQDNCHLHTYLLINIHTLVSSRKHQPDLDISGIGRDRTLPTAVKVFYLLEIASDKILNFHQLLTTTVSHSWITDQ